MDNQLWRDRTLPGTPWAVGSGVLLGALLDAGPGWRVQLEAAQRHYVGRAPREQSLLLRQRVSIGERVNLSTECAWRRRGDAPIVRGCRIGVQRYY